MRSSQRSWPTWSALPRYAGHDTATLQAQREDGELERENKRVELDAAIINRGAQSVFARKSHGTSKRSTSVRTTCGSS